MVNASRTFQTILREEFEERSKRNPRYSLRAFARDLGLSPSRISEVFAEKKGLSKANAVKVARKLGYTGAETELFVALVESTHGRGKGAKQRARESLGRLADNREQGLIQLDVFKIIADWYHYAILELTYVKGFDPSPRWISRRLRIPEATASTAIQRLLRLGMLEEIDGTLRAAEDFTWTPAGISSESLKKHHEQVLDKAKAAIYGQSVEERELATTTFSIDSARLTEAKALIRKFQRDFNRILTTGSDGSADRVYCLAMQFFGLDEAASPVPSTLPNQGETK